MSNELGRMQEDEVRLLHYSGSLGEFDYDPRMYKLVHSYYHGDYLQYIESSGLAPLLPRGCISCRRMFCGCEVLTEIDLSKFGGVEIEDTSYMFCDSPSLVRLDLSCMNLLNVKNMRYMFFGCKNLEELILPEINKAPNVDKSSMFFGADRLDMRDRGRGVLLCAEPNNYTSVKTSDKTADLIKRLSLE